MDNSNAACSTSACWPRSGRRTPTAVINKRMIYEYFGSKELLYKQVLFQVYRRLETAEMLTVRTAEHNGRLRKYYHLTPQGLARIEQFKTEWGQIVNIYQFILSTEGTEHDES